MPELPKPRRIDWGTARRYIKETCGLENYHDVDPAFFDALCHDDLYFLGDLNIPSSYQRSAALKKNERVSGAFWRDWGYHTFDNGTFRRDTIELPNQTIQYDRIFFTNLTIETALIDAWLNNSHSGKVKVSAVPEKEYKQRVEQAISMSITYSRGEDREWAKARGYSVESVQELRKNHAPQDWQGAGRRPTSNLQKESAN